MMPDLRDIKTPVIAKDSRSLEVHFDHGGENSSFPFRLLSDGEKCMAIWALVIAANEAYGPLFCFWDEPDSVMGGTQVWLIEMLVHNRNELLRMQESICPHLLVS